MEVRFGKKSENAIKKNRNIENDVKIKVSFVIYVWQ